MKEICVRDVAHGAVLEAQLAGAMVLSRKNTGAGFYTDFSVPRLAAPVIMPERMIGEVWAKIEGFMDPMTFLIFIEDGYACCLEGAAVRDNTVSIDLAALKFEILPI